MESYSDKPEKKGYTKEKLAKLNRLLKVYIKEAMSEPPAKVPDQQTSKRKRPTGVFKCDYKDCGKSFTRAEHLARHKLNHNPTVIYECPWEDCSKSFVRSDLRERHVKRHNAKKLKEEAKRLSKQMNEANLPTKRRKTRAKAAAASTSSSAAAAGTATGTTRLAVPTTAPSTAINTADPSNVVLTTNSNPADKRIPINKLDSIILPTVEEQDQINIHNYNDENHISIASHELNALTHSNFNSGAKPNIITGDDPYLTPTSTVDTTNPSHNMDPNNRNTSVPNHNPSNLMTWLFDEDHTNLTDVPGTSSVGNFFNSPDDPFGFSVNLLDEILNIPPNFPNPVQQTLITPDITKSLIELIPNLAESEFLPHLEKFLELYWKYFHTQYPILHKPSFNTFTCPPILLLAMIMTGAGFAKSEPNSIFFNFVKKPREFGDLIAEPLRMIIFSSKDFNPPSKIWIVQSLLILECYERYSTNRMLHERSYIHHGTTIQLLRRSPGLGGNPLRNKTEHETFQKATIWEKWIEYETVKRVALFAFFIDATHSMIFGYLIMLSVPQIQVTLPCDDELWESSSKPGETPTKNENSLQFLVGLKKLLNREHVETSRFGKKILLAGLITILFQLQQRDLQGSILDIDQLRDTWKETVSLALDFWKCEIMKDCCNTDSTFYLKDIDQATLPSCLRSTDTRCKFPQYHMAQITLRIQHYDYYIYSGAPWRMNVGAEESDYVMSEKKVHEWARSQGGRMSVIYGYLFLFEMFLSPQNSPQDLNLEYNPDCEVFYDRPNALALVTLLVWSYNFQMEGPESDILKENESLGYDELVPKEDGYSYLRRIRAELTELCGEFIHTSHFHSHSDDGNGADDTGSIEQHKLLMKASSILPLIKHKNQLGGLLKMMSSIFSRMYWEVAQEFSRLIRNCVRRNFGSLKRVCDDMYTSENHD